MGFIINTLHNCSTRVVNLMDITEFITVYKESYYTSKTKITIIFIYCGKIVNCCVFTVRSKNKPRIEYTHLIIIQPPFYYHLSQLKHSIFTLLNYLLTFLLWGNCLMLAYTVFELHSKIATVSKVFLRRLVSLS